MMGVRSPTLTAALCAPETRKASAAIHSESAGLRPRPEGGRPGLTAPNKEADVCAGEGEAQLHRETEPSSPAWSAQALRTGVPARTAPTAPLHPAHPSKRSPSRKHPHGRPGMGAPSRALAQPRGRIP